MTPHMSFVIPAQAGIQHVWTPAFAGVTIDPNFQG